MKGDLPQNIYHSSEEKGEINQREDFSPQIRYRLGRFSQ